MARAGTCVHMHVVERLVNDINHEYQISLGHSYTERFKRILCGELCGGHCQDQYIQPSRTEVIRSPIQLQANLGDRQAADKICCSGCHFMKVNGRALYTRNNSHLNRPRGDCFCSHPDAEAAFRVICPQSSRMPGFISFTKGSSDEPDIQGAPRWCPLRLCEKPREISGKAALQIIESRKPRGLFFHSDEKGGYTGIDNRTGNAWCEEFPTKHACVKWLLSDCTAEEVL